MIRRIRGEIFGLVEWIRQAQWVGCRTLFIFLTVEMFTVGLAAANPLLPAKFTVRRLDPPASKPFWMFKQSQVGPKTDLSRLTYSTKSPSHNYDWSGIVVHQAGEGPKPTAYLGGFTMVTKRHGIGAKHAQDAGPVKFVGKDNRIVVRKVVAKKRIGKTDIEVITLDEDVPATVRVYKVMTHLDKLNGWNVYSVRHNRRVFTRTLKNTDDHTVRHTASSQGEPVKSSGKPMLVAADGKLFLLCVHYTASASFAIAGYIDEINSVVSATGDYKLITVRAPTR